MTLVVGAKLGPYDIVAPLGAGGMGEVYRAHDRRLQREVAIKVLPDLVTDEPNRLARFEREAQMLAALNHPHIAAIYGLEESNGTCALVMELVEGPTLADRIAHGPIPIDEALPIARQIAEALEAAHEQGIIHRDLKPANIKVREDGTVKVLDFGLAKALDPATNPGQEAQSPTLTSPAAMTRMGVILGTAAYMSPEQARGKAVDKRTDIWAFGCVLYEMLTAMRAFGGDEITDTLAFILTKEPDWSALPADTPVSVRRLLRRCFEKDRKRRLADIADARLEIDEPLTAPVETLAAPIAPRARTRERVAWALVAIAVLAIGALAVPVTLYVRRTAPEPLVTRFDIVTPPTIDPFSFALAPDGRQLAFVANGEKGSQLWLRPLDQVMAQPLAGTEGAAFPFWAPDGRTIGFFADGKLKRLDAASGAQRVVADAPSGRGATWNRDGVIVFAPGTNGPLMRVMATGGTPAPVTKLLAAQTGETSHRWPQFLPDGRTFLFVEGLAPPDTRGVYIGSLDGETPTRVLAAETAETAAAYAPPGYLVWVRQGTLLAQRFDVTRRTVAGEPVPVARAVGMDLPIVRGAFTVSAAGVLAHRSGAGAARQLVWVDRTGQRLAAVGPLDDGSLAHPELAPDGQRVAVNRQVQGNPDVWLMDIGRGVPSRFTFALGVDGQPTWSADGSRVIFLSTRKGTSDLFEKPANDATNEQPLLVSAQDKSPQGSSPDGRVLLYSIHDSRTGSDLWALPLIGERKPFPVVQTSFEDIQGQWSPDGRWLAYASNESGRYEIYLRPFPTAGGKTQVSTAGGVQPRWRKDGRELFYVAPDSRLMAAPIRLVSTTSTVETGAPVALFSTRLASGGNIASAGYRARAQYAVAADGRFLMNVAVEETATSPITIVLNWTAGLKQ